MTYRDDKDLRPTFWERERFKRKIFGPIFLVFMLILIAAEYFA
jgi:hypothetical protein